MTIQVQTLSLLCKGHMVSPEVTNAFLPITHDRKGLETRAWSQCVRLIKTHRLICDMTYLGNHVTLT